MLSRFKRFVLCSIHIVAAIFILYISNDVGDMVNKVDLSEAIAVCLRYTINIFAGMLLCCVYVKWVMGMKFSDIGFKKPYMAGFWLIVAVLLPLAVELVTIAVTNGEVMKNELDASQITRLISLTLSRGIYSGLVEETVFRGVILKSIEKASNRRIAVLGSSLLFTLLHVEQISDSQLTSIIQVLIAGMCVSIMFCLVLYASSSIWPGIWIHTIWNMIVIGKIFSIQSDVMAVYNPEVYTYVMNTKNILWTGGDFGIEASLISISGYLIVAIIAAYKIANKR